MSSKLKKQMNSPLHEVSVFNQDETSFRLLPLPGVQLLRKPSEMSNASNLIVVSSCNRLIDIAPFVSAANHRNALRALLIRNDNSPYWTTRFLHTAGLRALRNLLVHAGNDVPRRIIGAWAAGAQHKLIADATVLNDQLLVLDCALKLYELPFNAINELRTISTKDRSKFTIDEDGSDICWVERDISIDIGSIESVLNPEKSKSLKLSHDKTFGQSIAIFRNLNGLRQTDIPGLTERQVRGIEKGERSITLKSLNALASAHKLSLKDYMNEVAE